MLKRVALLFAGGAVWLLLAAVPVFADGGPHVLTTNNGSAGINADSCAGCHRTHTAQAAYLLKSNEADLCLTCHGAANFGATTDVMSGVQYAVAGDAAQLGALRGGGFVNARIDAGNAFRETYGAAEVAHPTVFKFDKKVGVGASEPATSGHMKLAGAAGVTLQGTAWGNGAFSATANPGPAVSVGCATCHNPHGNGQYRILNPIPTAAGIVSVSPYASTPINVTDAANPTNATRNYTVIQYKGPLAADRYLLAGEISTDGVANTAGDYLHQVVPYNARPATGDNATANHDGPNGDPAFFNGQINAWCSTCHSRYTQSTNFTQAANVPVPGSPEVAGNLRVSSVPNVSGTPTIGQPMVTPTGDGIFNYRHTTSRNRSCLTCHVSHGSNAAMAGTNSSTFTYPDGTPGASSRLLKVDNRGTCQVCHDPTETTTVGTVINGPAPTLP